MNKYPIVIGSDHAGFEMKKDLKGYLEGQGYHVTDLGPASTSRVDYPDYAESIAFRVSEKEAELGILICGTGIGMSIVANKVPGVRAAILYDETAARYARLHNDANVIIFGGRTMDIERVKRYLDIFLGEKFEGGRHRKRLEKIDKLESLLKRDRGGR